MSINDEQLNNSQSGEMTEERTADKSETMLADDATAYKKKKQKEFFKSLFRVLLTTAIVWALLLWVKMPYVFEAPGTCEDTSKFITVADGKNKKNTYGRFYLTTVYYERANLLLYLWGIVDPSAELRPIQKQVVSLTEDQDNEYMDIQMDMSKLKAEIAAFRELGYDIPVKHTPVRIIAVSNISKAVDVLKRGDMVLTLNGEKIAKDQDLLEMIKKLPEGEDAHLTIDRDGRRFDVTVPLTIIDGRRRIGIVVVSQIIGAKLPIDVKIDSKNISGASAGLMFTLEILKQISGVDLTGGHKVAGTGVIDENGNVYSIEGVKFKIQAAEKEGAEYFLVPDKNYSEASQAAKKIKLHSVKTLEDALEFLKELNPSATLDGYKTGQE